MRLHVPLILSVFGLVGCAAGDNADGAPWDPGPDVARGADAAADATALDATTDVSMPDGGADGRSRDADRGDGDGGAATDGNADGPLPYPTRSAYRLKALQPDFWPNKDEISGNNAGGVAMNFVWASWEGSKKAPPCDVAKEEEYDGHCFTVDAAVDAAVADWSARGLVVTGVLYGVPAWARTARRCNVPSGREIFCAPDDATDYGRFAGMVARRYDGRRGHGRVADFVIHNEVNANDWFNVGCGNGVACDTKTWLDVYAANYIAAFDRVVSAQPFAKVLVSLEHHFASPDFDQPSAAQPLLSGQTLLTGLASRVAPRPWRVAFHPYPPDLLAPAFSPDDWPKVTYGSLGALPGWLRKTFPNVPSAFELQLTESGVNSLAPSSPDAQADGVCRSFQNVLGTPGVENYVYHRMKDHPAETASGLGLGLREESGTAKPAWAVWALANRVDLQPPQLSCGFEDLPNVKLTRSYSASRGHWASSRLPPSGFSTEASVHVLREATAGTALLYECKVGAHNLLSPDVGCEGLLPLGPVGYVYTASSTGRIALYRCRVGAGSDHFVTTDAACEGQTVDMFLGYAIP